MRICRRVNSRCVDLWTCADCRRINLSPPSIIDRVCTRVDLSDSWLRKKTDSQIYTQIYGVNYNDCGRTYILVDVFKFMGKFIYKSVNAGLLNRQDLESRANLRTIYWWEIHVNNMHFRARLTRDSLALLVCIFVSSSFFCFVSKTRSRGERVSVGRNTSVGDIGGAVVRARPSLRAPP